MKIYSVVAGVGGGTRSALQKKQEQIALSLAVLVVFFVSCWTPALVMGVLHVARVPFAEAPIIDIIAALFATLNSAFSPILDMYLFPALVREMLDNVGLGGFAPSRKPSDASTSPASSETSDRSAVSQEIEP